MTNNKNDQDKGAKDKNKNKKDQDEGTEDNKGQGQGNDKGNKEEKGVKASHVLVDEGKEDHDNKNYEYKENARGLSHKISHKEGLAQLTHKHATIKHRHRGCDM